MNETSVWNRGPFRFVWFDVLLTFCVSLQQFVRRAVWILSVISILMCSRV